MAELFYDADADLSLIQSKKVAIVRGGKSITERVLRG